MNKEDIEMQKDKKGHPMIVMLVMLIVEKQAQNWLFNRNGFISSQLVNYIKLDFLVNLDDNSKEWISKVDEHLEDDYTKSFYQLKH